MENKKSIYYIIGKNIKTIRKERGLTAFQLSKKCNLSHGYLKNLEAKNVEATISIETLALIAEVLNVDITDLLKE